MKCEWDCGREATKPMFIEIRSSSFQTNTPSGRRTVKVSRTVQVCDLCYAAIKRTVREPKPLANTQIEGQMDIFEALRKEGQ
jgi:hypothetical protein